MATSFNIAALTAYTDELSMDLVAKAVLNTDLLSYTDLRTGMTSGTFTINLVDSELPVTALSCGGYPGDGQVVYTQVPVTIDSLQSKTTLCPEDLRSVYQSAFMSAGTGNDFIPFEEVISESYSAKLTKSVEDYLINGAGAAGTGTGLRAQMNAGANTIATAAVWTVNNAIEQALDIYDAIDESVINRDDIVMVVGPANYRTLVRALVAQGGTGLFHYKAVEGNEILMLPGTNCKVVMSSGLTGASKDQVFAGPSKFIVAATGLADELDSFRFQYSVSLDAVLFKAAWRIGVGVSQVNLFATNGL